LIEKIFKKWFNHLSGPLATLTNGITLLVALTVAIDAGDEIGLLQASSA